MGDRNMCAYPTSRILSDRRCARCLPSLQGGSLRGGFPGLKAWAVMYNPPRRVEFGANPELELSALIYNPFAVTLVRSRRYSAAVAPVNCRKILAKCWLVAKPQSSAISVMLRSESFNSIWACSTRALLQAL